MTSIDSLLDELDWVEIYLQLDADGYALLPGLLDPQVARSVAQHATVPGATSMPLELCDLGRGQLLSFSSSLPEPLELLRAAIYRRLVVIANRWSETIGADARYPLKLEDFLMCNKKAGQTCGQSHLSRLGVGDFMPLHQRNNGTQVFPMQIVAVLSEPETDFKGGEFVMTEQRPRMQSRPSVMSLKLGDLAVIATAERPFKGAKGYYRVNLKHAISRVHEGERIGLELSFHNAPQSLGSATYAHAGQDI